MSQRDQAGIAGPFGLSADYAARARSAWRSAIPALLLALAVVLVLYRDTATGIVTIWHRSETFAHGFVVVPITLWLIWRRRADLAQLVPRPSPLMLVPLAGLALMWLLGDLVAVNSVTQLAFVAMLVAVVPALLGFPVARVIAFPLAFLFFAVPIGEFMMPRLMEWTAEFTILALRASGIPVFREGLNFVIPSGNWSVVEACSGVRYLIASLTVGTLYAYLNYQSTQRRVIFILVSILVPIVANWLRAYMIVMLGHYSGNTLAVGVDHLIYGWVFFGIVIMAMFWIGARWSEPELPHTVPGSGTEAARPATSTARMGLIALAAAAIVALPLLVQLVLKPGTSRGAPQLAALGALGAGWVALDTGAINFTPNFENPSAQRNVTIEQNGDKVGLYLAYYRDQGYERKLVSSNNVLVRSEDDSWRLLSQSSQRARWNETERTVHGAVLRSLPGAGVSQPEVILVWQVYWINGALTSNDYVAKVMGALYQLLGRGDDSAVIVVYTPADKMDKAQETLTAFLSANYGAIDAALRNTKGGL